jgi:hypothetical protein
MLRRSLLLLSCSAGMAWAQKGSASEQRFPDVVGVKVRAATGGNFDFDVTLSSPYDTPQRYADAFRVLTLDGKALGERILWHDHQDEQPFTRDLYGIKIPAGIKRVMKWLCQGAESPVFRTRSQA